MLLRQVILNPHSRDVVRELDALEVLFVEAVQSESGGPARVRLVANDGTWLPLLPSRTRLPCGPVSR